ncbi:hypothetical protein ACOMHN_036241 [Nucella lapillus]
MSGSHNPETYLEFSAKARKARLPGRSKQRAQGDRHSHHTPAADKPRSDSSNVYGLPKKSNLCILTLNCQRILGKTAELAAALKYLKPDIVCGTESWLHGIKPGANPSPDHVK